MDMSKNDYTIVTSKNTPTTTFMAWPTGTTNRLHYRTNLYKFSEEGHSNMKGVASSYLQYWIRTEEMIVSST